MIEIVEYRSEWPAEFARISAILRHGLGRLATHIDHIGSTSVPGLAAKDVIDIQVTVVELKPAVVEAMELLGFVKHSINAHDHIPPGGSTAAAEWAKFLFVQQPGDRRANIHVRQVGRANQRYPLLFRDYLRAHPAASAAYAELKRRLAAGLADPGTYPDVKDPAVDLIYFAAEAWAAATGWTVG